MAHPTVVPFDISKQLSLCIMCVQYRGDAQYRGGYHEYRGGIS